MVTWSRNDGRPLRNTPDGNVLRIETPEAEDSGVYQCSAEGVVAMFNLVVMEPPPTDTSEGPVHEVSPIPRLGRSLGMGLVIVRCLLATCNYNVKKGSTFVYVFRQFCVTGWWGESSLVSHPHAPPGEKLSGEQS